MYADGGVERAKVRTAIKRGSFREPLSSTAQSVVEETVV